MRPSDQVIVLDGEERVDVFHRPSGRFRGQETGCGIYLNTASNALSGRRDTFAERLRPCRRCYRREDT